MLTSFMKLSRPAPSAGKKQMLRQLWHMWGSDVALSGLPVVVSEAVDEGLAPPPTSPVPVLDGHSAMNTLCWTNRCVIVVMATCVCEMFPPIGGCCTGGTGIHHRGRGPSTGLRLARSRSWADPRPAPWNLVMSK